MKRRKKEFGLYNILGMEKRHLAITLAWETIILYVLSMIGGLIIGIALDKILFLLLRQPDRCACLPWILYLHQSDPLGADAVSGHFYSDLHQLCTSIQTANPIELLHSDSMGEREPKSRFLLAFFGILSLGSGYFLATRRRILSLL